MGLKSITRMATSAAMVGTFAIGQAFADPSACDAADAALRWVETYAEETVGSPGLVARPVLISDTFDGFSGNRLPRPRTQTRAEWRQLEPMEDLGTLSACNLRYAQNAQVSFITPRTEDPRFKEPESTKYSWRYIGHPHKDPEGRIVLRILANKNGIGTVSATLRYDPRARDVDVLAAAQVMAR